MLLRMMMYLSMLWSTIQLKEKPGTSLMLFILQLWELDLFATFTFQDNIRNQVSWLHDLSHNAEILGVGPVNFSQILRKNLSRFEVVNNKSAQIERFRIYF